MDPEGTIRVANAAAERILGFGSGELAGSAVDRLVPSEGHALERARYLESPEARPMGAGRTLAAFRKDGSERLVEVGLFPSLEGQDVFATLVDVSEREEARRALSEAQQINKTGTWSYDLETDRVVWSPELFRIFRLPVAPEAPPYDTHHELFSPESWARLEPAVARAAERGIPYELELELSISDEQGPLVAVARCEPQVDADGTVGRLVGTFQDVTELARTRRQHTQLLQRFSLVQIAAKIGVWEWDPDTLELLWDPGMHELYGVPPRPVTYDDWRTALHPEDLEAAEAHIQEVLSGDGYFQQEFRVRHPSGERHILAAASIHHDERTGARRMVGINMDVTESVLARRALRQREAHIALMMEALPDAVFTVRMPERRIDFVNQEVRTILGYEPAEVIGRTTRLFYPDDASFEEFGRRLSECLERGEPRFRCEELLRRKDGSLVHCEITVGFEIRAGELVGVISSIRSIEERWQAQKALRERREQWDSFFAGTSNMLWNWDFATDHVERNEAFQTALGYAENEVGSTFDWWTERVHEEDLERVQQTFAKALETGAETTGYTYRLLRRDGTYATIRDRVFIMRDESGRAHRALGAMTDITEQVRREEQSRRANNLESLGLLAGGIAHDFNNQLSGILALSELLNLVADDPAEVRELTRQIGEAVDASTLLTRQLLTFSKGGAPTRRTVALDELVREHAKFALTGSSTRVTFDFAPDLWAANVDPGQIAQVIQNLVINADQAMERGGELRISACNSPAEDPGAPPVLELRVTDAGPGMAPETMRRIFDPYFTTKATGHGLGLSICHSIVERHEGTIRVESNPDQGTSFIVRLPAAERPGEREERGKALTHGSARVLLVDDLEDVRRLLGRLMTSLGYRVDAVANVEEAVRAFLAAREEGDPHAVVVTDLTIPGTPGGLEVLRRIRLVDPNVPVVVSSGYANDPVLADHEAHGFDEKLTKPVRLEALSRVLASVLDER